MELRYTWTDYVDFGAGGQFVGIMEGPVSGERLSGDVKFVNVPAKRPDNVNCPAFRGVLLTGDGVKIYVELNGIALLRQQDNARLFTTSLQMRTGDATYEWVNRSFGVLEGILNNTTDVARTRAFLCEHELAELP
jgi:hypothetical protein